MNNFMEYNVLAKKKLRNAFAKRSEKKTYFNHVCGRRPSLAITSINSLRDLFKGITG